MPATTPTTPALTDREQKEVQRALQKAGESLSWNAGFIALPWLKLRGLAKADPKLTHWAIGADGTLSVNPQWFVSARPEERVFTLAHGMLRFLLRHHDRGVRLGMVDPLTAGPVVGQEHEHQLWGEACAATVNKPLQADSIGRAPADAVFPPADYAGSMDAEGLYYHLLKTRPKPPPNSGPPPPPKPPQAGGHQQPPPQGNGQGQGDDSDADGQGQQGQSGTAPAPAPLSGDEIDQMRREVEALAKMAGQGNACVEALKPKVARTNYRSVIGAGLDCANTESSERTKKTYSRASRREAPMPDLILPGSVGEDPSICVVIDFSGSTGHFAQKFVDHAQKVAGDYPNVRIYLVAHTDRVTYESWLKPGGDAKKLSEASAFSGGTDFAPAYEAARKVAPRGKFDALVHFTDGYNFGDWPMPPARRLVVGLCGAEDTSGTTPLPMPAKVIPVTMEG